MVADVADIDRLSLMPLLLRLCAARTANELNVRSVADDLSVPYRTVGSYLTHLQTVFLVHLLPAWSRNLTSKVVHRPKLMMVDSGLAAHLLGVDAAAIKGPTAPAGPLFETFVAMELRKQLGWSDESVRMHHFRDRGGAEVDIVLEASNGTVAGVEVKASSTVRSDDFRGLRLLQDKLGHRFVGGVVLYTGHQAVPFGDRLAALPAAALWQTT
jgi:predicted AAA+ superfamily ATPase